MHAEPHASFDHGTTHTIKLMNTREVTMSKRKYVAIERLNNESDLGGLDPYIVRKLAEAGDGTFRIFSLPIPRDNEELDYALRLLNKDSVVDCYIDKTKIVYALVGGFTEWHEHFSKAGITITNGKNNAKYRKSTYRPTEVALFFDEGETVAINIVNDEDEFSPEDLSNYTADELERPLDGFIAINRSVMDRLLATIKPNQDPLKAARQRMRVMNSHEFNIRVFTNHFIKGDASPVKMGKNMHWDFKTSRANLKSSVRVSEGGIRAIIAQPMNGNNETFLNIQENVWFHANNPGVTQMFTEAAWDKYLADYFRKALDVVKSGQLTERFEDIESSLFQAYKDIESDLVQASFTKMMRWGVIEAAMRGFDYRTSPFLMDAVARGMTEGLKDRRGHAKLPLPNAVFKAIKSESAIKLAGYSKRVEQGYIEYFAPLDVWVVNDHDWINNYTDWGTHDGDDKWVVMSVDLKGEHYMLTWRLPMDSYVAFKTKSKGIPYTWSNGDVDWAFPMNGTLDSLPKPLTKLMEDGEVTLTGLPSMHRQAVKVTERVLTKADVEEQIRGTVEMPAGLGIWVNALFLYRLVFRKFPSTMLALISDVVDASDPEDMEAIMAEARKWIEECLVSGKPIPRAYWVPRQLGFNRVAEEIGIKPNLSVDGKLDKQIQKMDKAIDKFRKDVRSFSQEQHGLADNGIKAVLKDHQELVHQAIEMMILLRRRIGQFDAAKKREAASQGLAPQPLTTEDWIRIMHPVMESITSKDEGFERDIWMLAMYYVCHTVPTRTGNRFNDNLVMQSLKKKDEDTNYGPLPYMMKALRNFGIIADQLSVNDDGELVREYKPKQGWSLICTVCGKEYLVTDHKYVDNFVANDGVCKLHR